MRLDHVRIMSDLYGIENGLKAKNVINGKPNGKQPPTWQGEFKLVEKSEPEKHDSQGHDRILRLFLLPEIGQFSPHFQVTSLL